MAYVLPFLSLYFIFWSFSFFNLSIVDLQCCVSVRCTAEIFSYIQIYSFFYFILSFNFTIKSILFQILFPYSLLQDVKYGGGGQGRS